MPGAPAIRAGEDGAAGPTCVNRRRASEPLIPWSTLQAVPAADDRSACRLSLLPNMHEIGRERATA